MKIRHITGLLAAALTLPTALGASLKDAKYTMLPTAGNESLTLEGIGSNIYTVLKLDVEAFAEVITTASSQTTVASVQGSNTAYLVGLATTAAAGGLTGQHCTAGSGNAVSGTAYPYSSNTANGHHIADGLDDINWDDVTGASITFVHNGGSVSCAFLSIQKSDTTFAEYYGGSGTYHYSSMVPTTFNVNSDLVSAAFVFNGTTSQADATALNHAAIAYVVPTPAVPEPTTATLSMLALAGLAARRRK